MPFVFIVLGIGLVIVAIRGTQATAFSLLKSEFSGQHNFLTWALAIFILGGVGYIPVVRPITRALLLLVLLVIFLVNGKGLFAQFNKQVANPIAAPTSTASGTGAGATPAGTGLAPLSALPPLQSQSGSSQSFIGNLFGSNGLAWGGTGTTASGGNGIGRGAGGTYIDVGSNY